jgi:hypothetical protein
LLSNGLLIQAQWADFFRRVIAALVKADAIHPCRAFLRDLLFLERFFCKTIPEVHDLIKKLVDGFLEEVSGYFHPNSSAMKL